MTDGHQEPGGRQHGPFPKTQATKIPQLYRSAGIYSIQRLEKGRRVNIWPWKRSVYSMLVLFGPEDIIDNEIPQPCGTDPSYEHWKAWTKIVRCWLLNHLSTTVIENLGIMCRQVEVEVEPDDRLPRYANDLYNLIPKAFMIDEESPKLKAAITVRTIRRLEFESAGEYIEEWRKVVLQLKAQKTTIDSYIATKLMLLDLRNEMPMTTSTIEDKIERSVGCVDRERFLQICDELIEKSKTSASKSMTI